jgi:hypothetical protein
VRGSGLEPTTAESFSSGWTGFRNAALGFLLAGFLAGVVMAALYRNCRALATVQTKMRAIFFLKKYRICHARERFLLVKHRAAHPSTAAAALFFLHGDRHFFEMQL